MTIQQHIRTKSKFFLPNAITALSIVMGMASVSFAFEGKYVTAAWVILYSTILDKLDGSTARALNASSPFGGQLDSFSDFVAFGVAPTFLVYAICSHDPIVKIAFEAKETPFFLYFALIFFILTSAMRLARFNLTSAPGSKFMMGLATTAAGGYIAIFIIACYNNIDISFVAKALQAVPYLLIFMGILQISNLPIAKVGAKKSRFGNLFDLAGFFIVLFCIITRSFPEFMLIMGTLYLLVGFGNAFPKRREIYNEWKKMGVELPENEESSQ